LTIEFDGSFSANQNGSLIQIFINNQFWTNWIFDSNNIFNCTIGQDTQVVSAPIGSVELLTGEENMLEIVVPSPGPVIYLCGAIVTGFYVPVTGSTPTMSASVAVNPTPSASVSVSPSPSASVSVSPSPSASVSISPSASPSPVAYGFWEFSAPVATTETCAWTNTSVCSTEFFDAYGQYGTTWTIPLVFYDETPYYAGLSLQGLSVQFFGSFDNNASYENVQISVTINSIPWTTWNFNATKNSFNCTSATDTAIVAGGVTNTTGILGNDYNQLEIVVPNPGPVIFMCGANVTGLYFSSGLPSSTSTTTLSATPSTSATPSVSGTVTPTPSTSYAPPEGPFSAAVVSIFLAAVILGVLFVVILTVAGCYNWRKQKRNGYYFPVLD